MRPIVVVVALFLVLAMVVAGCGDSDDTEGAETTASPETSLGPPPTAGEGEPNSPGLYSLGGDRREAYGFPRFIDLEGGFWALVDDAPGGSFSEEEVIVVIVNADSVGFDWEGYQDAYVRVEGTLLEGVSIRMAGPELEISEVEVVQEFDPPDGVDTTG